MGGLTVNSRPSMTPLSSPHLYASHHRNARPWCADRLPSDISKMAVSTVSVGGLAETRSLAHIRCLSNIAATCASLNLRL